MYEEVFHRIILENVPNVFRIKRSLESFINAEIERQNLPKMKALRLARTLDANAQVISGQMIMFNTDEDHEKLAKSVDGLIFMGHTLRTRIYRVVNICVDSNVTITLTPPKQTSNDSKSAQQNKQAENSKDKDRGIKRKLQV